MVVVVVVVVVAADEALAAYVQRWEVVVVLGCGVEDPPLQKYPALQSPCGASSPVFWQYVPTGHGRHWRRRCRPVWLL